MRGKVEVTLGEFSFEHEDLDSLQYQIKQVVMDRVVRAVRSRVDEMLVGYCDQLCVVIQPALDLAFQRAADEARELDAVLLKQLGVNP